MDATDVLSALHQQFRTDRLLGLQFLPFPPDTIGTLFRIGRPLPAGVAQASQPVHSQSRVAYASQPVHAPTGKSVPHDLAAKQQCLLTLDETQVRTCRRCTLCESRTQTVFGQGNAAARLVFVGEGPGFEEDRQGLAFVGPAGQLLTKMITAMGLTREDVYICNVVKCRPPQNRTPAPEEIQACNPFLREQLDIIAPEVIVALGAPATQTLLNTGLPIGRLRGRFHDYYFSGQPGVGRAVPVMPTYHPAYLLRTPSDKGKTWDDLQQVMAALGLKPASK